MEKAEKVRLAKKYRQKQAALTKLSERRARLDECETVLREEMSEIEEVLKGGYLEDMGISFNEILSSIANDDEPMVKPPEKKEKSEKDGVNTDGSERVTGDTERGSGDTLSENEEAV